MSELLFQYEAVHPTTWVYLSSLLMLGLFFKFNRFWSVRNLDLVLLILLSPGLLLVHFGERMMAQSPPVATPNQENSPAEENPSQTISTSSGVAGPLESAGEPVKAPSEAPGQAPTGIADESVGNPNIATPGTATSGTATSGTATPESTAANSAVGIDKPKPQVDSDRASNIVIAGYVWLLCSSGIFLTRLLLDPTMVRRPLLEPNLSTGGLVFIGCSLFVFMMANIVNSPSTRSADLQGSRSAAKLLSRVADKQPQDLGRNGPGNALLHSIPALVTNPMHWNESPNATEVRHVRIAKLMGVLSNLAIVLGIVLTGYRHFGSTKMGLGAAALYLMLPYNNLMAGHIDHVLPAALLVWAILCYRQPLWAGMFIGMSIGVVYYPLFLLPLWISFYWERGLMRFLVGVGVMILLSVGSLSLISVDMNDFLVKVRELFGIWWPRTTDLQGIWGIGWNPAYRYPVLAAFITISGAFALWPAQKNLGTLLSCSAAVMVATQFWHGNGGGLFMAWYLPLTLLTVFRPNLEDRVALSVLGEGWFPRRRKLRLANVDQAA